MKSKTVKLISAVVALGVLSGAYVGVKSYTSAQEAIQNPGSNIEYTITVSDKWTQGLSLIHI